MRPLSVMFDFGANSNDNGVIHGFLSLKSAMDYCYRTLDMQINYGYIDGRKCKLTVKDGFGITVSVYYIN